MGCSGPLIELPDLFAVAAEVCSAMAYLHSEGVVHGDLAGGNVLLMSQSSSPHGFTAKVCSTCP